MARVFTIAKTHATLTPKSDTAPHDVHIESKRSLTSGEIALAKLIYKDSIDYSKVKIIRGGLLGIPSRTGNAMTPFGSIHLPESEYQRIKDFSIAKEGDQIWLIHEMGHVWQYSLGYSVAATGIEISTRGGYGKEAKAYDYDLNGVDAGKKLPQFNMEQQADVIAHYFDAIHLAGVGRNKVHSERVALLPQLQYALQDFIKNPNDKSLLPTTYGKIHWLD
jgi:hypothetical protein